MDATDRLDLAATRALVRALMQSHALTSSTLISVWGGPGEGAVCSVCGLPIRRDEHELELRIDNNGALIALRLHPSCHVAWEMEASAVVKRP